MNAPRYTAGRVRLKRVYEVPEPNGGYRVLVDRLWPRGLARQKARIDLGAKDVAPSAERRRWYHKDLARWPEFRKRYEAECDATKDAALDDPRGVVREHTERGESGVTLVYGSASEGQNHAIVLREAIQRRAPDCGRDRACGERLSINPERHGVLSVVMLSSTQGGRRPANSTS